jgi:hypothetical protein
MTMFDRILTYSPLKIQIKTPAAGNEGIYL